MKKNKTVLGLICIVVAIILTFVVSPLLNSMSAEKITIVRVVKEIPEGAQIKESDVTEVEVGRYNLPENVIREKSEVIGMFAAVTLKRDVYLLPEKITGDSQTTDYQFRNLKEGEFAMSIAVAAPEHGLSGALKRGDVVSVIVKDNSSGEAFIPPELERVTVITTTTSSGIEGENISEDTNDKTIRTVTLRVTEVQAIALAKYENIGKIHLALAQRGEISE